MGWSGGHAETRSMNVNKQGAGFKACPAARLRGEAPRSLSVLICNTLCTIVRCPTQWPWEVNAIVHRKHSAQALVLAIFSLHVNNNEHQGENNNPMAPGLLCRPVGVEQWSRTTGSELLLPNAVPSGSG